MKKIFIIFLILSTMVFTGCAKRDLENPYFDNSKKDTFEDAYLLFAEYLDRVKDHHIEYFPLSESERALYDEDAYINTELSSKDQIYRHEFFNYHLSDDRSYMLDSQIYTIIETKLYRSSEKCKYITEGKQCLVTERADDNQLLKYGLIYYMEDDQLFIDYMYTEYIHSSSYVYMNRYTFYFYQDETLGDVMEMTYQRSNVEEDYFMIISSIKLVFDRYLEEVICHSCENLFDINSGPLEYLYVEFKPKQRNTQDFRNTKSFIHVWLSESSIHGDVFDGTTGELFGVTRMFDGTLETSSYAKFIRNTYVVNYSSSYFMINLNEVLGWDLLVKVPNENKYQLQYNDEVLSDQYLVSINVKDNEYPYFETSCCLTDDILSLSIFGLSTPYNQSYFSEKFDLGSERFEAMLQERNLNLSYAENYANFIERINRFRESIVTSID